MPLLTPSKTDERDKDDPDRAIKNREVLVDDDTPFGLPSTVFFVGLALGFGLGGAFGRTYFWWWVVPFFLVYYPVMYSIHREDTRAFRVWLRALLRPISLWRAGSAERRVFWVVKANGDRLLLRSAIEQGYLPTGHKPRNSL
jgi:hypothetical protein